MASNQVSFKALLVLHLVLLKGMNMPALSDKENKGMNDFTGHRCDEVIKILVIRWSQGSEVKEAGGEPETNHGSRSNLASSSTNDEVRRTHGAQSASDADSTRRSVLGLKVSSTPKAVSVKIVAVYPPGGLRFRPVRRFAAEQNFRFNRFMSNGGRNHTGVPHSGELSKIRFERLEFARLALHIRLQGSTPQKLSETYRLSATREEMVPKAERVYESSSSPMNTDVFLSVHIISVLLCSSQVPDSPALESVSCRATAGHKVSRHNTTSESDETKQVDQSPEVVETSGSKYFTNVPFWSKVFSSFNHRSRSFSTVQTPSDDQEEEDTVQALNDSLRLESFKTLFRLIVLMTVLFRYLPKSKESKKYIDNSAYFRILTRSFFLNWHWHSPTDHGKTHGKHSRTNGCNQTKEKSEMKQGLDLKTMNEHVFRPWLLKKESRNTESLPGHCLQTGCCSFDSAVCRFCQECLNTFQANNLYPVPRFLPDATLNPGLDLVHVGYRLATLSALPPSVSVSRVMLADAGFYFHGQGDEVVCYSCGVRHSGWTAGDKPVEIHRRKSPNCPHVLERDRESPSLASHSNNAGGARVSSCAQESVYGIAPGIETNGYVEDGEDSHAQTHQTEPASEGTIAHGRPATSTGTGSSSSADIHGGAVAAGSAAATGRTNSNSGSASHASSRTESTHHRTSSATQNSAVSTAETRTPTRISSVSDASSRRTGPTAGASRADARPLFPRPALDLGLAVYPMYQDMASRRRSFNRWDERQAPPLEQVLLSGMFYAGYADCVRCFYCGVGLKHWVVTDDVWTEHVRWRPACGYLRTVRGDDFIRDTQRRLGIEPSENLPGDSGRGTDVFPEVRNDDSQTQQPTTAPPTATNATTTASVSTTSTTAIATTTSSSSSQVPRALSSSSTATTTANGSQEGATAATLSGATAGTVTTSQSAAAGSGRSSDASEANSEEREGSREAGTSLTAVSSAAEDGERLARLQAENRALTQRFQCKICHNAAIDTILMPCGHLVVCETCARSVTSCPLCQDTIRATARVHMA